MKNLNDRQLAGLKLLSEIDKIFSENNVWYSLACGTALGAVREKGFIQWDYDIDIMVKVVDQCRIRKLLLTELSTCFCLITAEKSVSGFDSVIIKGMDPKEISLDIYPLIGGPGKKNVYHFQRFCAAIHNIAKCKHLDTTRLIYKWKLPLVWMIRSVECIVPDEIINRLIKYISNKFPLETAIYVFPLNGGPPKNIMRKELLFCTIKMQFETLNLPVPSDYNKYLKRIYGRNYMTPIRIH